MKTSKTIFTNLSVPELYEQAVLRKEGFITAGGPFCVTTGKYTARAPKDKYIVKEPGCADKIWWNDTNNVAVSEELFDRMLAKIEKYLSDKDIFARDCFAGADPRQFHPGCG